MREKCLLNNFRGRWQRQPFVKNDIILRLKTTLVSFGISRLRLRDFGASPCACACVSAFKPCCARTYILSVNVEKLSKSYNKYSPEDL